MGPCMCGDPYCNACFPGTSESAGQLESAMDWAIERFDGANVTPAEIRLAVTVGLRAVSAARKLQETHEADAAAIDAENQAWEALQHECTGY